MPYEERFLSRTWHEWLIEKGFDEIHHMIYKRIDQDEITIVELSWNGSALFRVFSFKEDGVIQCVLERELKDLENGTIDINM